MPELPDIELYLHTIRLRVLDQALESTRIISPFVLRTVDPPVDALEGKPVRAVSRLGKRIVFEFDDELFLVVHLMIAGRFRWNDNPSAKAPGKISLASMRFPRGVLHLVEPSQKKRAGMWVVAGRASLAHHDPGGVNVLTCPLADFASRLRAGNHTIKRVLTDPRVFDGIGNAYSDEILHAAKLSPVILTSRMSDEQISALLTAAREVLSHWIETLRFECSRKFPRPGDVTAFRPEFAVHGKFGKPCPACGTLVQRIRFADSETNYCPRCQTGGKLLADRSLSRLLKKDWPGTIDELEELRGKPQ